MHPCIAGTSSMNLFCSLGNWSHSFTTTFIFTAHLFFWCPARWKPNFIQLCSNFSVPENHKNACYYCLIIIAWWVGVNSPPQHPLAILRSPWGLLGLGQSTPKSSVTGPFQPSPLWPLGLQGSPLRSSSPSPLRPLGNSGTIKPPEGQRG